ncbi:hypothetical protein PtA15_2A903 [Puccinia triticina]|uniref:HMG box domain-containing protein n=1 Tax=Puccinia triticina TaxID=208348 RepID=A0ABY7CEK5_9BASI|nr:uncharacterized protein PtA15_2A903 [Puccinia triticina]WAQ82586.1 hypothetical protein PtA15_2A903 [Puccinia triticina]
MQNSPDLEPYNSEGQISPYIPISNPNSQNRYTHPHHTDIATPLEPFRVTSHGSNNGSSVASLPAHFIFHASSPPLHTPHPVRNFSNPTSTTINLPNLPPIPSSKETQSSVSKAWAPPAKKPAARKPRKAPSTAIAPSSVTNTPSVCQLSPSAPIKRTPTQPSPSRKRMTTSDSRSAQPQSKETLMQMTEAKLALQAQESSKGAMSDADRQFFARFYSQQRKELIIQAIEREVSMLMVDGYLGKRMIIKKPNCFNEFMKTPQARSVFRGPHKGVKDKTVMGGVASRWHALTPEEQEKFRKAARSKPLPDADDDNPDDGSESNTDEDDKQPISTALKSGICRTISFKRASEQVANFMDLWVKQAVHIAKTCNCEMVFFAVSRHLGLHSFQYTQSTHGASAFVAAAQNMDGLRHYPARMQGYLAGYKLADLAALAEGKKTKNKAVSAVARMSTLVAEKTNGALTQWPWTNTDEVLAEVKYRVVLLPGGKTQLKWIKSPSRDLHVKPQAVLLNDLENNLINVVHDPTMPDPVKSPKFTKRITEKKQPPKHASKGRFRKRIPSTSSTASLDSEQIATTPSASENSKTGQQEGSGASENGTDLGDI